MHVGMMPSNNCTRSDACWEDALCQTGASQGASMGSSNSDKFEGHQCDVLHRIFRSLWQLYTCELMLNEHRTSSVSQDADFVQR